MHRGECIIFFICFPKFKKMFTTTKMIDDEPLFSTVQRFILLLVVIFIYFVPSIGSCYSYANTLETPSYNNPSSSSSFGSPVFPFACSILSSKVSDLNTLITYIGKSAMKYSYVSEWDQIFTKKGISVAGFRIS